jgi:hypothetical protein
LNANSANKERQNSEGVVLMTASATLGTNLPLELQA